MTLHGHQQSHIPQMCSSHQKFAYLKSKVVHLKIPSYAELSGTFYEVIFYNEQLGH